MNEFSLIEKYFNQHIRQPNISLGVGDDCALLRPPSDQNLAVSTDTLIAGVHFFSDIDPIKLGHKCLAVNLSDLAAMGATPAWTLLSLSIPSADEDWLERFCHGFFELAKRFGVALVGGDLTHGPLSVTVQVMGFVPEKEALRRDAARVGDSIFVSGFLGDAGAALAMKKEQKEISSALLSRLDMPMPQIDLGIALRKIAHAVIDISDGLAADLQHILDASHVGAKVIVDKLPLSSTIKRLISKEKAWQFALSAGDDYELCFTVPQSRMSHLSTLIARYELTHIGYIEQGDDLKLVRSDGSDYKFLGKGYLHF